MIDIAIPFAVFLIGIATGFVDSTVGGGGLISIPFLIFIGLPPQIAIATDRLGCIGQTVAALPKYWKAKKIIWKFVPIFIIMSIISAYIGANLLLDIEEEILQRVVAILLLTLLPLIFFKHKIGIHHSQASTLKKGLGLTIYFLLMIFGAFFGGGVGPLVFYTLMYFLGFTIIQANATKIIPWFLLSLFSLIIFVSNGIVHYKYGIILLIGMAVGGYFGAHVAIKKGDTWVKRLFAIVVVISGIKLLFF